MSLSDLPFLHPPEKPDEIGRLGEFRVLAVLGRGGMGVVLKAEDARLMRLVALKVIRPEFATDAVNRERFLREGRAAAALHHDNVVPVYQVGEDNGTPFLAMPLLAGESLEERVTRDKRLPPEEVLRIGRDVAAGLAAAHACGLIHRDIKPSNIWLEAPTGRARLLDFGLARPAEGHDGLTGTGAILGTPAYMSPEQADGMALDGRSDLFSLGVVLYRLATGQQPFARGSATATLRAVADHQPPPPHEVVPNLAPPLSHYLMTLLAKAPAGRPATASAVAEALQALGHGDTAAAPPSPARHRRTALAAAAGSAVLALLAVALLLLPRRPEPPAVATYQGSVDVLTWPKRLRLGDTGALPLQVGQQIRVEATVTPPAYVYLFWIDSEGKASPIYPWTPGRWGTRPGEETPRDRLRLPLDEGMGWTLTGDKAGMETLLLLARPTPLDADDATVRAWFADLKPQRPVQNPNAAVWFENGRVVTEDVRRRALDFDADAIDDPVLRLQALLRDRLAPHAPLTTAVSFAREAK